MSSGVKALRKTGVNLVLEAPPEGKCPSETLTLQGREDIQAGAAQGRHPTLSLFSMRRAHREIWYHMKSCGSGLTVDRKGHREDPYFSEFRGRGGTSRHTSLCLPSRSSDFSSWDSRYHQPWSSASVGRWLFAVLAAC